jgi:hypothetical protein
VRTKDCEICGNPIASKAFTCRFCGANQSVESFSVSKRRVVRVVIKQGMPTVDDAMADLDRSLRQCLAGGVKVVRLVHGYGSTGRGGRIRDAARRELGHWLRRGEVTEVVYGERYESMTEPGRTLLTKYPELQSTLRDDSGNPGMTMVVM